MGAAACKAKIILNGASIYNETEELCAQVEALPAKAFTDEDAYAVVRLLNTAEDAVMAAKRVYLEMVGFEGPWPAALDSLAVRDLVAKAQEEGEYNTPQAK